ncbi:MAG: DUF3592 domain-containing protein [Acidobacteria bacterium]|nr:DUF3592 domain-containing protein [Acidobacteriota bacterium]MCA1640435.1 DUF3592 domain-containing protein [Acidobacteriota bacterium]
MSETFLLPLIFSGVGALLLLIAVFVLTRTRRFVAESLRAQGQVVGFEESAGDGGTTYAPVVTFTSQSGDDVQFTDSIYSRPRGYDVGQQVEVLYHYRDHSRARLASPFRLYFVPGLLGFIGLVFTSVGVIVFWFTSGRAEKW